MSTDQAPIYGGQAVIEGVMIRGQRNIAVAVRRPDGSVATMCHPLTPIFTSRLRRIPLIRGVIAMAETLALGMRALSYSANVAAEAEGEEISKGSMAGMMLVSLSLAIGIFFLIPVFASDWLEELIGSALLANIAEGIIRLVLFLGYILLISRMDDIRRPARSGAHPQVPDRASALRHGVPASCNGRGNCGVHLRRTRAILVAHHLAYRTGAGNSRRQLRSHTLQRTPRR